MESREAAFMRTSGGVRRVFHQLRALSERLLGGDDGFTASHRGVLESLVLGGPQTVPALARARPVARQHVQRLVNDLAAMRLVELRPNPAHKRSMLVAATAAGSKRYDAIRRREREFLARAPLPLGGRELRALADSLDVLARGLDTLLE